MPKAIWGTPQPASEAKFTPYSQGLASFMSGEERPDFGEEFSDRAGIIAQILMNLGSGRGGVGIAEATAAANERSAARREDSRNKAMVNRMADKLEPSNPEMAMMMRANTKFGLTMLGKQLEDEWTSKSDMAKLNKQYELAGANEIALQREKEAALAERARLRLKSMGLLADDSGGGTAPAVASPASITPDAGVVPPPTGGGGGGGPAPAPVVTQPQQTPPPMPTGEVDYTAGLVSNPQLRTIQLQQRKIYGDPDMPIEDVLQLIDSGFTDTSEGANTVRKNVQARRERRERVQGIQTRGQAADAAFQAGQGLPGINMNAPGELEMRGAGIDPKLRPDLNPVQTAERLRVAAETGPEQYNSLLGQLAQPAAAGSLRVNPITGQLEVTGGGKPDTEAQDRNEALSLRAQISMPILDDPTSEKALLSNVNYFKDQALPTWLTNSLKMLPPEYKLAKVAGANYLSAILRQESLSAIKEEEFAMYGPFLLPQPGDDPDLLKFKSELRQRTFIGMARNMSPAAQLEFATTATRQRNEAIARGETPPPIPDITQWPTEGTRQAPTGTQPAPAPSPVDELLKKYPPKPAAGP